MLALPSTWSNDLQDESASQRKRICIQMGWLNSTRMASDPGAGAVSTCVQVPRFPARPEDALECIKNLALCPESMARAPGLGAQISHCLQESHLVVQQRWDLPA